MHKHFYNAIKALRTIWITFTQKSTVFNNCDTKCTLKYHLGITILLVRNREEQKSSQFQLIIFCKHELAQMYLFLWQTQMDIQVLTTKVGMSANEWKTLATVHTLTHSHTHKQKHSLFCPEQGNWKWHVAAYSLNHEFENGGTQCGKGILTLELLT